MSNQTGRMFKQAWLAAAVALVACSPGEGDSGGPSGEGYAGNGTGVPGASGSGGSGGNGTAGALSGGGTASASGGTGGIALATGGASPSTGGSAGSLLTGGMGGSPPIGGGSGGSLVATGGAFANTGGTSTGGQPAIPALQEPIDRGAGSYVLEFGDTYFEVNAAPGARIVRFSKGGVDSLLSSTAVSGDAANNFGSTFWTSPQSAWDWPPPSGIDTDAYSATVDTENARITMIGPVASVGTAQVQVTKIFTADLANDAIVVDYQVANVGAAAAAMASWEISRVPAGGLTFFPTGTGVVSSSLNVTQGADGISYFDWATSAPAADGKFIGDGADGWIAHVGNGLLFLKVFEDVPLASAAPGEADVEIYATSTSRYVEVEPQGPYVTIQPSAASSWTVVWKLRELPQGITQGVSAPGLVDFARSILD